MASYKVKVKCTGPHATREQLLSSLSTFKIRVSRISRVDNELMLIYCNAAIDIDAIFSPDCLRVLSEIDCEPMFPTDLQAKRSIIIKRLDPFIYARDVQEIEVELMNKNNWVTVCNIYKFPRSKTIKVSFSNQQMVELSLNRGLLMFNLSVSPVDMVRDSFTHLLVCYRCYQWNDHVAANCKKAASYIICSLCSSDSHCYKECNSNERKCINCKGNHYTLSYKCPIRKSIADHLQNERPIPQPDRVTVSAYPKPSFSPPTQKDFELNNKILKSAMCLMMCCLKKHTSSSEFSSDLCKLLNANDLPMLELGEFEPPTDIFHHVPDSVNTETPCTNAHSVDTRSTNEPQPRDTGDGDFTTGSVINEDTRPPTHAPGSGDVLTTVSTNEGPVLRSSAELKVTNLNSPVASALKKFSKITNTSENISNVPKKSRYVRKVPS